MGQLIRLLRIVTYTTCSLMIVLLAATYWRIVNGADTSKLKVIVSLLVASNLALPVYIAQIYSSNPSWEFVVCSVFAFQSTLCAAYWIFAWQYFQVSVWIP